MWTAPNISGKARVRISDADNQNYSDLCDVDIDVWNPSVTPKSITLESPLGGENLESGSDYFNISIKNQNVANVVFDFSNDNGQTWEKIETLSAENQVNLITQTVEAAKNQADGVSTDDVDLTNTIAEIVTKSDTATAAKMLETLDEVSADLGDSKLSLSVVSNLTKQENYEEKMEELSSSSSKITRPPPTFIAGPSSTLVGLPEARVIPDRFTVKFGLE